MLYDFDKVVERHGSGCEKYDNCREIFGTEDVLPLWIADSDFAVAPFITEAIKKRMEHPVLGYCIRCEEFYQSAIDWVKRRNGWEIKREWMDFSPGVVAGIVFALRAFTREGDGVVIQPPVYPPFARMTELNNRKVLNNALVWTGGRYEIDFDDLDLKLSQAKAFLMSNPHNPSGRVYTREELQRIGDLCVKHDVFIISDEIHSDLVQRPYHHIHIASLSEAIGRQTVTIFAPSKTFNIAGLSTSVSVVTDETTRKRFHAAVEQMHIEQGNIFGTVALEAAYKNGDEWLDQFNDYIGKNADYVLDFLTRNIPSIRTFKPEGTFLMWLDFSAWGMTQEELCRFLVEKAKLGMNDGLCFGEEGRGFMRMNIAAPLSVMKEAMDRLLAACKAAGLA